MTIQPRLLDPGTAAKVLRSERGLREAVEEAIRERRVDGDLQAWVNALQSLYNGEDVSMWQRDGRVL